MIKLLLVEDDANLCYIIRGGLEDMIGGYEVMTASNGEEGLKIWKEQHLDIIISDIEMPVMDGYEMVRRIRETDGFIPIVFTSGRVSPKDVVKGYELGVNNYIKKPFLAEELDAHIGALLKMKRGMGAANESEIYRIGENYTFDAVHAVLKHSSCVQKTMTERYSNPVPPVVSLFHYYTGGNTFSSLFIGTKRNCFRCFVKRKMN